MDKPDIEYYWMCKRIQSRAAIPGNATLINAYLPYKSDIVLFNTHIATLESLMPEVLVIGTGSTTNQDVAKRDCSTFWVNSVCKTFKGFAIKYKKYDVLATVNFTISKLQGIKIPLYYRAIVNLNAVGEAILLDTDYIAGAYNVNAGVLTAGMVMANTFLSCTGVAKEISNTKNENGAAIKVMIQTLRGDVSIMDNDVWGILSTTYINQYFVDRKLVDSSLIHNKVMLNVTDLASGLGIDKVFVINEGATKGDYTNIDGFKELHKAPRTNILLLTHKDPITGLADYHPVTIRCRPIFKGTIDVNVVMTKIVANTLAADTAAGKKAVKKGKKVLPAAGAAEIVTPAVKGVEEVKALAPAKKVKGKL